MLLQLQCSCGGQCVAQLRELLFQLSQPILGSLGGRPVHNQASDIGLLVGDVTPEVGYLPIRCVRLVHGRNMLTEA